MKTLNSIALAAALSAVSAPAFAADSSTCSVCGDPTFPTIDRYAPSLAVKSDGGLTAQALEADPTWPAMAAAAPVVAAEMLPGDGAQQEPPVPSAPRNGHAAVTGHSGDRVASR